MIWLLLFSLACAALPALLYFRNVRLFRPPPTLGILPPSARERENPRITVLIPARNEELSIRDCIDSILASSHVELECIVLDDASLDRTAEIVREIALHDPRLRLETAPSLPVGWSGKQHACFVLSKLASNPTIAFLDADVRLAPDALMRMIAFQQQSGAALVSGFPRQETGTILEKLVIPLMHFLLLGFLPLARMRTHPQPSLGAGCGQWFLTTRDAYNMAGSHAAIKDSFHDGIQLPRAYRKAGLMTDICDVTTLATCRMYRTGGQVWNGLAKNAKEGLGAPRLIVFATLLLFGGQVLPFVLLSVMIGCGLYGHDWSFVLFGKFSNRSAPFLAMTMVAVLCAIMPRIDAVTRFQQSRLAAALHPFGVLILLGIQWYALIRAIFGRPVGWKGRPRPHK